MNWVMYLPNLKTQIGNRGQQPLSESNDLDDLSNFTTLEKVALTLIAETGEGCYQELVELSAESSFSSMGLKVNGSMR